MKDKSFIREIFFYLFALAAVFILVFFKDFAQNNEKKIVGIDIKGEVNAPGYYELEFGSRIKDAIIVAGGEKKNADLSSVNLAMQLVDGEEIVIPTKNENNDSNTSLININTADMYKLCKLDGIGESTATKIINYRAENGEFKSIEDLKKVKGIGTRKFNEIKDKITVQ